MEHPKKVLGVDALRHFTVLRNYFRLEYPPNQSR